jgi:gas vesicle protein
MYAQRGGYMKFIKTVLRAFIFGLVVGILIAPRAGKETRQMLSEKFDNLMDKASGGASDLQQTP